MKAFTGDLLLRFTVIRALTAFAWGPVREAQCASALKGSPWIWETDHSWEAPGAKQQGFPIGRFPHGHLGRRRLMGNIRNLTKPGPLTASSLWGVL